MITRARLESAFLVAQSICFQEFEITTLQNIPQSPRSLSVIGRYCAPLSRSSSVMCQYKRGLHMSISGTARDPNMAELRSEQRVQSTRHPSVWLRIKLQATCVKVQACAWLHMQPGHLAVWH